MNSNSVYFLVNEQLRQGCHKAFVQVYSDNSTLLYHFIKKYVKDPDCIDDLIHDTFFNLWKYRHNIKSNHNIEHYIFRIARNNMYKFFKEELRIAEIKLAQEHRQDHNKSLSVEDLYVDGEFTHIYTQAVNQLPPQRQKIFKLCREEGLSHKEIADLLNVSTNTVKEHMSLALKTIRTYLTKEHDLILSIMLIALIEQ